MRHRRLAFLALALLLGLNLAGATVLSLTGSDPDPFEKHYSTQCAKPTVTPVSGSDGGSFKVRSITLTGDFSKCVGQQVLVTLFQGGHAYSYGVYDITSNVSTISLSFDSGQGYGSFKQKFPLLNAGRLQPWGPATPAQKNVPLSDVQVTFAEHWT